jgi:hypothetical protein
MISNKIDLFKPPILISLIRPRIIAYAGPLFRLGGASAALALALVVGHVAISRRRAGEDCAATWAGWLRRGTSPLPLVPQKVAEG